MPKIGRPDSYESEQQIPDDKLEKTMDSTPLGMVIGLKI
jgi:hypothetical protein